MNAPAAPLLLNPHTPRKLLAPLTVTDLFAGGGGSSEGLRQAGCEIVIAANHNPVAVLTALVAAYWGLRKVVR